jgi:small subunit ribosomal protein S3
MQGTMKSGAKGIKVQCSGRLGGAEMSRSEFYREGRVPQRRRSGSSGTTPTSTDAGRAAVEENPEALPTTVAGTETTGA